jgi:glucuronokinase
MEIIRRRAYARAGLAGNPSDGYNGKTLSIIVRNHWAEVTLYEWDQLEIVASRNDQSIFRNIAELAGDVSLHGYYGGVRLIKATIKGFYDYCTRQGFKLKSNNFSIRYESNIPRQVGLAGSSAIIVATFRCLFDFYNVEIPINVLPSLVLSIERDELGIMAGFRIVSRKFMKA